jgi:hypothetical protein
MATQVQFRRGTTTQNNAFTGAAGEITYDTDVKTLRLHDGVSQGGGATVVTLQATQTLFNKTASTGSVWQGNAVGLAYGGTGSSLTPIAGAVAYGGASGIGLTDAGTSGQVLTSGGSNAPSWVNQSSLTVGTAGTATLATNISGGSPGYLPYQADSGTTSFIAPGAAGTFLISTGSSTAPSWAAGNVTFGTTTVSLGSTSTSIAGLTAIDATGVSTSFFATPTSPTLFNSGTAISIGAATGTTTINNANTVVTGDLAVNGGDITTSATTFNLLNVTATTLNFGGAATALTIGATTGTATIRNATVAVTNNATVGGTLAVTGNTTLSGTLAVTGNQTNTGDLAVNGGDITTTATSATLFNANATTIDAFEAATTINIGASTGTTTVQHNLVITGNLTVNGDQIINNTATMEVEDSLIYIGTGNVGNSNDIGVVSHFNPGTYQHTGIVRDATDGVWKLFSGVATEPSNSTLDFTSAVYDPLKIGALTAASSAVSGNETVGGTLGVTGATTLTGALTASGGLSTTTLSASSNGTITGDLAVNGGDLTTTSTSATLFNTGATTLSIGGAATAVGIGASTGTTTINNNLSVTGNFTVNGTVTTVNSTTVNMDTLMFVLGGDIAPTVDDNKDRGVEFRWHNGTVAKMGFFGFDDSTGYLTYVPDATDTSGVISGTLGTIDAASITGSASRWTTARTLTLAGDLSGSVSIDGSAGMTLTATIVADSVALGTDTTGNYVASLVAGTGISVGAAAEGATPTITNTGVTSITGTANQIVASASTGGVTLSAPQNLHTGANFQVNSLGVGTTGSGTAGEIRATGSITGYYSDDRLKDRSGNIQDALAKVLTLNGFHYQANAVAQELGYAAKPEVGISAQEVQAVMPEVVVPAPIDDKYLTVQYERLIPLLIEAIKEQQVQIEELKAKLG